MLTPHSPLPHIRVVIHVCQHAFNSLLADRVSTTGILTNHTQLAILLQPLRGGSNPVNADSVIDALIRGTRAVAIEILVHLKYELILRIRQSTHRIAIPGRNPCPSTRIRISLGRDILAARTDSPDSINRNLVEVYNERLVHTIILVVRIKHNEIIGRKRRGNGLPEGLEPGGVGDDVAIVTAEVVRAEHGIGSKAGDTVHGRLQAIKVGGVQGSSEFIGNEALHEEGDAEDVHSCIDEDRNGGEIGPDVLYAVNHVVLLKETVTVDERLCPRRLGCSFQIQHRSH